MTKRYDLIVFDWDGTVMDSTAIIAGSIRAACRDLKLPVPDEETARHVIGLGLMQALRHAVPDAPEEMYEPLTQRYRHHFLSQNESIPLFDRARETIAELHDAGYRLAVATGKNRNGLDHALESTGMGNTSMQRARRTGPFPNRIRPCCWRSWMNWMCRRSAP